RPCPAPWGCTIADRSAGGERRAGRRAAAGDDGQLIEESSWRWATPQETASPTGTWARGGDGLLAAAPACRAPRRSQARQRDVTPNRMAATAPTPHSHTQ